MATIRLYGPGLAHVMVLQLVIAAGWPWPWACPVVIAGGGQTEA